MQTLRTEGRSSRDILRTIEARAARNGQSVPRDLARQLEADDYAETGEWCIMQVEPDLEGMVLDGQILAFDAVSFLKRLSYPDNPISRALLGQFGKEAFLELRVRGEPDATYGVAAEARCFISERLFTKRQLRIGAKSRFDLRVAALPDETIVWIVASVMTHWRRPTV